MLHLDKKKLETKLKARGVNLARLAKLCNVSRQSIYNMFEKNSVFNTTFEKILSFTGIDYLEITTGGRRKDYIIRNFPDQIKKIALSLCKYAAEHHADMILFGSRAAGKKGIRADWDFAIYFHRKMDNACLARLSRTLTEKAFPYRIDIVNLNAAPDWFKSSIEDNIIYLRKEPPDDSKKNKKRVRSRQKSSR